MTADNGARTGTVLVVDDHELISTSLTLLLAGRGFDAHRCTDVASTRAVLGEAQRHEPGLVLLDLDLGGAGDADRLDGESLIGTLTGDGWDVLVVTGTRDRDRIAAALAAGACGYVSKSAATTVIIDTAARAAAGQRVIDPETRRDLVSRHRAVQRHRAEIADRLGRLSAREREVLGCLAAGQRASAIAERFWVSLATVRAQIRSILAKLEVDSQLEAVALLHDSRSPLAA